MLILYYLSDLECVRCAEEHRAIIIDIIHRNIIGGVYLDGG